MGLGGVCMCGGGGAAGAVCVPVYLVVAWW